MDWGFSNLQLWFLLFGLLFSHPDCFRVNQIIFYCDRNPYELGRQKRFMYIEKYVLMLILDRYCCIWVTLTRKIEWLKYKYKRYTFPFT